MGAMGHGARRLRRTALGNGLDRRLSDRGRSITASLRMLPTVLLIGGQKCGTSSLHHYLVQHPDIGEPQHKEVHYFDINADRSTRWYRAQFPMRGIYPHAIDSSPYYLFHPAAPARAHELLPDARLIVLLRDPVARTYSHYHHARRHGFETLEFDAAIAREEERLAGSEQLLLTSRGARSLSHQRHSYVSRSVYAPQIARWLAHFDREQFLFLSSEELFADPAAVVSRVQSWLGVSAQLPDQLAARNVGTYRPMEHSLGDAQTARFLADRTELEQITGERFPWAALREREAEPQGR